MEIGHNLVDTWLRIRTGEVSGVSQEKALKDLNRRTGRRTGRGRLWEWKEGKHTPPPDVIRVMLEDILPQITPIPDQLGRKRAQRLAASLCPPDRTKGKD